MTFIVSPCSYKFVIVYKFSWRCVGTSFSSTPPLMHFLIVRNPMYYSSSGSIKNYAIASNPFNVTASVHLQLTPLGSESGRHWKRQFIRVIRGKTTLKAANNQKTTEGSGFRIFGLGGAILRLVNLRG